MKIELTPDCCAIPAEPEPAASADRLAAVFRALGDPTRLDIYRFIAGQAQPVCVCHLVDRSDVSQPTVSHHLKVLRDAGLVSVSRRGVWAYYEPTPEGREVLAHATRIMEVPFAAVAR